MSQTQANEYLTVEEARAYLKIGLNGMYQLIKTKRVKSVRLSAHRIRVTRRALDNYVAALGIEQMPPTVLDPVKLRRAGRTDGGLRV